MSGDRVAEDLLIAEALEVTVSNIASLQSSTPGVIVYDKWRTVCETALALARSRLPKPPEPDALADHPELFTAEPDA